MTRERPVTSDKAGAYAWYVVFVLSICQALAAIDARLPYILVEALKRDLDLTDTQLGLITGLLIVLCHFCHSDCKAVRCEEPDGDHQHGHRHLERVHRVWGLCQEFWSIRV